jgi:hypothetical protein
LKTFVVFFKASQIIQTETSSVQTCNELFNQGENLEPSVATEAAGSNANGYKKSFAIQTS